MAEDCRLRLFSAERPACGETLVARVVSAPPTEKPEPCVALAFPEYGDAPAVCFFDELTYRRRRRRPREAGGGGASGAQQATTWPAAAAAPPPGTLLPVVVLAQDTWLADGRQTASRVQVVEAAARRAQKRYRRNEHLYAVMRDAAAELGTGAAWLVETVVWPLQERGRPGAWDALRIAFTERYHVKAERNALARVFDRVLEDDLELRSRLVAFLERRFDELEQRTSSSDGGGAACAGAPPECEEDVESERASPAPAPATPPPQGDADDAAFVQYVRDAVRCLDDQALAECAVQTAVAGVSSRAAEEERPPADCLVAAMRAVLELTAERVGDGGAAALVRATEANVRKWGVFLRGWAYGDEAAQLELVLWLEEYFGGCREEGEEDTPDEDAAQALFRRHAGALFERLLFVLYEEDADVLDEDALLQWADWRASDGPQAGGSLLPRCEGLISWLRASG